MVGQFSWPRHYGASVALRHGAGFAYLEGKLDGLRRFRAGARNRHCANLRAIIEASEKEILEMQRLTGFDLYWRLYFALT